MTINEIADKISLWANQYDFIDKVWLCGSTAKNKKVTNDIDLAFELIPEVGDDTDIVTWYHRETLLKSETTNLLKHKVDVILYNKEMYPEITRQIDNNQCILIYQNN